AAQAESGWSLLNMTQGVTEMSRRIYDLHMLIFWVCVAIAVVVFAAMIWSIVVYRKSQGAVADTTMVHNTKVEIVWTAVPVIILIAMAVPAARTLVEIEDTTKTELTIKVTGFQWGWNYEYLDKGVTFFSRLDRKSDAARELGSGIDPNTVEHYLLNVDNPLVVPVGTKVRLLVTGADVIHSWWVPAFGVKKDGIPGFVNEAWFNIDADKKGLYRGQCAELCGRDHGFMPIVVDARSKDDFAAWLKEKAAQQKQAAAPAAGTPTASAPVAITPIASTGTLAPAATPIGGTPSPAAAATASMPSRAAATLNPSALPAAAPTAGTPSVAATQAAATPSTPKPAAAAAVLAKANAG
ncbi:MAG: cytochrome c oxidase subunit 2, partial [Gammaproteobacteria bacterium]|nr:cytochrome c oxidase subunit 2 [Gammaproteobacteria bacterium]